MHIINAITSFRLLDGKTFRIGRLKMLEAYQLNICSFESLPATVEQPLIDICLSIDTVNSRLGKVGNFSLSRISGSF